MLPNSETIESLDSPPDWTLILLKKWAEQVGIHYHTARKLKKEGSLRTVKLGAQDFISVEEARRIAREGAHQNSV